jgi:hypothetical protein
LDFFFWVEITPLPNVPIMHPNPHPHPDHAPMDPTIFSFDINYLFILLAEMLKFSNNFFSEVK